MKIYLVIDDDDSQHFAFMHRKAAINKMYDTCHQWGAVLPVWVVSVGIGNYVPLSTLYPTEEEQLDYLYLCTDQELNEIFECYWSIKTLEVNEDIR